MSTQEPFTIEQFYKFLSQDKLMVGKCLKCGKIHLPPRPLCDSCYGIQFEWMQISGKGKLLTYTVIHIAPTQFQNLAPYAIGILELDGGLKIPGMIQEIPPEQLKIGMDLHVAFGACDASQNWPQWTKYCLKP
ncbi:MAG: Zn-ribbon domain-containing OB-fold protein [Candidatus Bathyarchaeota archaeon]|nr:Zn-ribbon domain-containing OB-fold protein [Candidatus Termiticorpusculum sp.]